MCEGMRMCEGVRVCGCVRLCGVGVYILTVHTEWLLQVLLRYFVVVEKRQTDHRWFPDY